MDLQQHCEESKHTIETHPVLLSSDADMLPAHTMEQYRDDETVSRVIKARQELAITGEVAGLS